MISYQEFFIAGIEDSEKAQRSAWGAFGMFCFTWALSCVGLWYDSCTKPDPLAEDEGEYQLAGNGNDFPNYGTGN